MSQPNKPMPNLDLPKQIEDLLQGRELEQLTPDERTKYYHLTAPFTNGTMSEITDAKEHDSAVRQNMAGNHVGQGVPTIKTPKRLFWNGPERDYGKAMFDESIWEDADILAVVPRYQAANSLHIRSPWDLVIYEARGKNGQMEIGMFTTKEYRSHSLKFGFKLDFSEVQSQLREGGYIPKDQVIGRSNASSREGDFQYAHECNVLFTTDFEVSEDQYKISTDVIEDFRFYLYSDPLIKYSRHEVALDLYGRHDIYQPLPLPGQFVRPDGLLMAFRKKGSVSGWMDYTVPGLRKIYDASDRKIHLDQSLIGYGKVIDVEVWRGARRNAKTTLEGTTDIIDTLANMNEDYYGRVVQAYRELRRRNRGAPLNLSHELAKYVHDAMVIARHTEHVTDPVVKQFADRTPTTIDSTDIDDYAFQFTIVGEKSPFTGDKFSDTHGT